MCMRKINITRFTSELKGGCETDSSEGNSQAPHRGCTRDEAHTEDRKDANPRIRTETTGEYGHSPTEP